MKTMKMMMIIADYVDIYYKLLKNCELTSLSYLIRHKMRKWTCFSHCTGWHHIHFIKFDAIEEYWEKKRIEIDATIRMHPFFFFWNKLCEHKRKIEWLFPLVTLIHTVPILRDYSQREKWIHGNARWWQTKQRINWCFCHFFFNFNLYLRPEFYKRQQIAMLLYCAVQYCRTVGGTYITTSYQNTF